MGDANGLIVFNSKTLECGFQWYQPRTSYGPRHLNFLFIYIPPRHAQVVSLHS
jgi:hypothetical protein